MMSASTECTEIDSLTKAKIDVSESLAICDISCDMVGMLSIRSPSTGLSLPSDRAHLFDPTDWRVFPSQFDKILTSWNWRGV